MKTFIIKLDLESSFPVSLTFWYFMSDLVKTNKEDLRLVSNQTSYLAWLELICVILLNMSINLRWLTFSPVASIAAEYMDVNMSAITWLANCATLIYMAISASTGWVFEKYGMKACVGWLLYIYIHEILHKMIP